MGSAVLSPSSRLEKRNASSTISVTETEGMEPTGKPGKELRFNPTRDDSNDSNDSIRALVGLTGTLPAVHTSKLMVLNGKRMVNSGLEP